jgi:hypothetical protein
MEAQSWEGHEVLHFDQSRIHDAKVAVAVKAEFIRECVYQWWEFAKDAVAEKLKLPEGSTVQVSAPATLLAQEKEDFQRVSLDVKLPRDYRVQPNHNHRRAHVGVCVQFVELALRGSMLGAARLIDEILNDMVEEMDCYLDATKVE